MRSTFTVLFALSLGTLPALAQMQTDPQQQQQMQQQIIDVQAQGPAAEPAVINKIAPYITQETVMLAHADLNRADLTRAEQWFTDLIRSAELTPAQEKAAMQQLEAQISLAQNWTNKLQQAGAEHVFLTINLPQQPAQQQGQGQAQQGQPQRRPIPAIIVPIEQADQAQQIQQVLMPSPRQQAQTAVIGQPVAQIIENEAVVLTAQRYFDQLKEQRQVPSANAQMLTDALSATSEAAGQFVFTPSDRIYRMMNEQFRPLPDDPGGAQLDLSQQINWVSVGVDFPEKTAVKMVIQAESEQAAQQVAQWINQRLEAQARAQQQPGQEAQLAGQAELLKPQVQGDRLTIMLTNQEAKRLMQENLQKTLQDQMPAEQGRQPGMPQDQMQQPDAQLPQQPGQIGAPGPMGRPGQADEADRLGQPVQPARDR